MTSFWTLSDNTLPSGTAESSHIKDFSIIPDGTFAPAMIKEFKKEASTISYSFPFYEITYKITSGDYKGREVRQKIKCFDEKATVRDRNINMLKRVYDLLDHKPTHANAPEDIDLKPMIGKVMGIKVSEFIGTNSKTGEPTNGNYVSEIHKSDKEFQTITGVKLEVPVTGYVSHIDTAFSRNANNSLPLDDSGIPF